MHNFTVITEDSAAARRAHLRRLPSQEVRHRPPKVGVSDVVRAVRGRRQVPPLNLVLPLSAGLHPLQLPLNSRLNRLQTPSARIGFRPRKLLCFDGTSREARTLSLQPQLYMVYIVVGI